MGGRGTTLSALYTDVNCQRPDRFSVSGMEQCLRESRAPQVALSGRGFRSPLRVVESRLQTHSGR